MRTNFRALLASVGKDQEAVKKIVGEQAGFSSEREMTCRNYLREEIHGFCAVRITQARALALQAAFEERAQYAATGPTKAVSQRTAAKAKPAANLKPDSKPSPRPGPGPFP